MEVISLGTDSSFCMDRISIFNFSSTVIFSIFLGIGIFEGFGNGLVRFERLLTLLRVSILAIRIVIMSFKAQRSVAGVVGNVYIRHVVHAKCLSM